MMRTGWKMCHAESRNNMGIKRRKALEKVRWMEQLGLYMNHIKAEMSKDEEE
jgi:hypothetical protein